MIHQTEVIIVGAGAAGLMCAIEAAKRGRQVVILEKTSKPGKKILMSGGGRCNFTNKETSPNQFISHNQHFSKSALSRYTQWDFIQAVERHTIAYFEKKLGQLFCENSSKDIVAMLLMECAQYNVEIKLNQVISQVKKHDGLFVVESNSCRYLCESLVIATGGLSIPTLGSSPFGYQIATQFGLKVYPTRAGLVPFTLHTQDKERFEVLSGISLDVEVRCNDQAFRENILFTHRGLSGPAMLQISSYWTPGSVLDISILPEVDWLTELLKAKQESPASSLKTVLSNYLVKRFISVFFEVTLLEKPMRQLSLEEIKSIVAALEHWLIIPNATEGYRTAEVTLGGVDCNEVSSKRFEANEVPGLFFVGEVLDVSGWLGGYNFQWAWSSGWAAGQVV